MSRISSAPLAALPTTDAGELLYATDTKELYMGTGTGNPLAPVLLDGSSVTGGPISAAQLPNVIDIGTF